MEIIAWNIQVVYEDGTAKEFGNEVPDNIAQLIEAWLEKK